MKWTTVKWTTHNKVQCTAPPMKCDTSFWVAESVISVVHFSVGGRRSEGGVCLAGFVIKRLSGFAMPSCGESEEETLVDLFFPGASFPSKMAFKKAIAADAIDVCVRLTSLVQFG